MSIRDDISLDGEPLPDRNLPERPAPEQSAGERLLSDHSGILQREADVVSRRRGHRAETDGEIVRREEELERMRDERHRARLALSERLGEFGFVYDPRSATLTRHLVGDPPTPAGPEGPVSVRAPFSPAEYGLPTPGPRPFNSSILKWIDGIAWGAVPFLGAFVGYSIGHLAGLRVEANGTLQLLSMLFGIAILATMKGSLYAILHHSAHRARSEDRRSIAWLAFGFASAMVLAEAGLGMVAIRSYSQDKALDASEILPWWAAGLIALCFSTPILVSSVVKGWAEGREHDDREEAARVECERYHRESAEAIRSHDERERTKAEAARKAQADALARFEAANESHREDPRWRAAMALFGAVASYDIEIDERKRLLDDYKIGRGFGERAVRTES